MQGFVVASVPSLELRARELARSLGWDLHSPEELERLRPGSIFLRLSPAGLELRETGSQGAVVRPEFGAARLVSVRRQAPKRWLLLRAVGWTRERPPFVLDATAGLGADAFLLAAFGCRVVMVERVPALAALLQDALRRAAGEEVAAETAGRMELLAGETAEVLANLGRGPEHQCPDVVYLDPMYPRARGKAAKAKEMRLARELAGADEDASVLLPLAREVARSRVVVKRSLRAPPLAGVPPSGSLRGTTVRFDIYPPRGEPGRRVQLPGPA